MQREQVMEGAIVRRHCELGDVMFLLFRINNLHFR